MALQTKVGGEGPAGQDISVNPLFAPDGEGACVPKNRLPDGPMAPDMAYEIVHDELMLDGNARLNLATFVTTHMEPRAENLMAERFRGERRPARGPIYVLRPRVGTARFGRVVAKD